MEKPFIEGIDSQQMQGGSYLRQADGSLVRVVGPEQGADGTQKIVVGPGLDDAGKAEAAQLLEQHEAAQAAAAVPPANTAAETPESNHNADTE